MGLFGAPPVLVDAVGTKLVNKDVRARRDLARAQLAILGEVRGDELLLVIAADRGGVVVVTNERIFTVRRGKVDRRIERADVRETKLGHVRAGGFVAIISGAGLRLGFPSLDEADRFVQVVDLAMVNSRVVTRDIPVLMPALYEEILRTSGRAASRRNVSDVAHAAAELIVEQARSFFAGTGDLDAADRFAARFLHTDRFRFAGHFRFTARFRERLADSTADDMIDWLWEWDPRCHQPLRRAVGVMRVSLLSY
ncbi:hypothetical protein JIG36_32680 [Actinoplanes sp. LDG1-06]|uniref:Uncharacterized protein n=1 Tax=Paractinoplanes ovalisporus TaxID=2810368 RepID=A0ABS2AKE2_9ACTN|nr:hypothetical protein [Actinoplanes ovalisporus]MBM2620281.1 hypothetical protein [Actinoplanes ovalisporus]